LSLDTFAGRNFRVSKYLTKTFAFDDFRNNFRGKLSRMGKIQVKILEFSFHSLLY